MIAQRSARVESELLIRNYSCYAGLFMHRFYDEGMTLDADVHVSMRENVRHYLKKTLLWLLV